MRRGTVMHLLVVGMAIAAPATLAQTVNLPPLEVTAPRFSEQHGGYLISGDFTVDPRMPSVIFPTQAFVRDDIVSVQPVHLNDDEYLVLQECASQDCSTAKVVHVWSAAGPSSLQHAGGTRIRIREEGKYFFWLKQLPNVPISPCDSCGTHYMIFGQFGPPLTLEPRGDLAARTQTQLRNAETSEPIPVATTRHDGYTFIATYVGGSRIHLQRMHAVR